ncbi:hypothetical protein A3K01_01820 [candidate division WWE3 bacterium RIFOXYD1_FULL_43_17]|uniref:Type II secretion system protein GspG C-terminal domain-containing protein n=3 Tax=Katanobacteria TaxID=422282 RepID=A0A1F4XBL3_UNCKA|nr:MAG: hypothetical protein UU59_C0011G0009 [candidate division WWE3 bacterium GW2011_GWE1_41_27]KKS60320.1 MAG: hypothetical protein UV26_C0005G0008 [candidate division WWE3 bacterium GW2011_GWF2_42_42]OGC79029.1 MAG: hypothetical protein A3K01_01820 [candidate division WWE3 bacterium RIFOXYD1_FULL_43_17]
MRKFLNPKAFTLLEITIVTAILLVLLGTTISLIAPSNSKGRSRDARRMSDISNLDRALNEYKMDFGVYPGEENTLYTSNVVPSGSPSIYSPTSGWVPADLSDYFPKYPTDPVNDATYHYEYVHNSVSYEISARAEQLVQEPSNDGGNDPSSYELGNNLLLISP